MKMRMRRKGLRPSCGKRDGLTTLEFLGCVIAVIGGAWLGAIYLGVDMNHLAHAALAEAELLERMPSEWRPEDPNQNTMTREQLVETLRKELGSLRTEIVALRSDEEGVTPTDGTEAQTLVRELTLGYWQRLSEIALSETALQNDAEAAFNESNAAKVFAVKSRISRFAAKAVEAIPTHHIDPIVVHFGEQLGGWYERGGDLYERAVQIWESPGTTQARAQLNKEWRGADLHHRNEARLMMERAAAVRGSLSRQFGEEFPEFATTACSDETKPDRGTTASVEQ